MILAPDLPVVRQVVADMSLWLEQVVIGLNLCPFAKAVQARGQLHWAVSSAAGPAELLDDLGAEIDALMDLPADVRDTSLLVAPDVLADFLAFNAFLPRVDKLLRKRGLRGVLQVASFHPQFEFADQPAQAMGHFSNRSPYPTLHLLREDSVARAVQAVPDAQAIFGRNLQTLARLGPAGWRGLAVGRSVSSLAQARPTSEADSALRSVGRESGT